MTDYTAAGVDLGAADRFVDAIATKVTATWGPEVVGRFGGFAAGMRVPEGFEEPVLLLTTDGVGTKTEVARLAGRFEGIGRDLVAMCVDDLAAVGARTIGLTDYLAVGRIQPERDETVVGSIAAACAEVGCSLLAGETAVHPGVLDEDRFDLAATALGIAERTGLMDPTRVAAGDILVGVASPNVRSNGFSLIRAIFDERALSGPLGVELLDPSVLYAPAVLDVMEAVDVHGAAHITGGGLPGNLPRVLPKGLGVHIDRDVWPVPDIFTTIQAAGDVADDDMFATFNMGVGFVLVVSPDVADRVASLVAKHGHETWFIGEIVAGEGVRFV